MKYKMKTKFSGFTMVITALEHFILFYFELNSKAVSQTLNNRIIG